MAGCFEVGLWLAAARCQCCQDSADSRLRTKMESICRLLGAAALMAITLLPGSCSNSAALAMSDEKRLTKHILDNYKQVGLYGRPVTNASVPVDVDIRFSLIKIFSVDFAEQQMTTIGMMFMTWTDPLLQWNPDDFGGTEMLGLPADQIWLPDIKLFNAVSAPIPLYGVLLAKVSSTGEVRYVPAFKFTSLCVVPEGSEDSPECPLTFGSWVYNTDRIHLFSSSERADAAFYVQNPEYELYTMNAETNSRSYKCCPDELYGDVTYTVRLRRRSHEDTEDDQEESAAPRVASVGLAALVVAFSLLAATL